MKCEKDNECSVKNLAKFKGNQLCENDSFQSKGHYDYVLISNMEKCVLED